MRVHVKMGGSHRGHRGFVVFLRALLGVMRRNEYLQFYSTIASLILRYLQYLQTVMNAFQLYLNNVNRLGVFFL